jgi:hypothetical protein
MTIQAGTQGFALGIRQYLLVPHLLYVDNPATALDDLLKGVKTCHRSFISRLASLVPKHIKITYKIKGNYNIRNR